MDFVKNQEYLFTPSEKGKKTFVGKFVRKTDDWIIVDRVGTNNRIAFVSKHLFSKYTISVVK